MNKNLQKAFTIVELLVVIVIIGVLSAIITITYSGINNRARTASLELDLSSASRVIELYKVDHGEYPESMTETSQGSRNYCPTPADTTYCIKSSEGNTYTYTRSSPQSYTLKATNGDVAYEVIDGSAPTLVETSGAIALTWKQIAPGNRQTCGVASDDNMYCWGYNFYGQLGNNSTTDSLVPVAVDTSGVLSGKTIKPFTAPVGFNYWTIAAGYYHSCAIASDDLVYCWGGNVNYSMPYPSNVPIAINTSGVLSGKTVKSIAAVYNTCVTASDLQVYCWGPNDQGQLGDSTTNPSADPVAVYTGGVLSGQSLRSPTVGYKHACVRSISRELYCWGGNATGALGDGSMYPYSTVPVAVYKGGVLSGKIFNSISAGGYHTCTVSSENLAYCWGQNNYGQVGNNSTNSTAEAVPIYSSGVLSGKTIISISAGLYHTCALASDNGIYCWGQNTYGQLGDNSINQSLVPVAVDTSGALSGKTIISVVAQQFHSCAIDSEGQSYCWGRNTYGQLGDNSVTNRLTPTPVSSIY